MPWISPTVHLYYNPGQPLTEYVDDVTEHVMTFTNPTHKLFWCHSCGRVRCAKDLSIHVYYDHSHITCTEKEYGRSPEFPFEYTTVCKGTAYKPKAKAA
jgi:hypothetical protein